MQKGKCLSLDKLFREMKKKMMIWRDNWIVFDIE